MIGRDPAPNYMGWRKGQAIGAESAIAGSSVQGHPPNKVRHSSLGTFSKYDWAEKGRSAQNGIPHFLQRSENYPDVVICNFKCRVLQQRRQSGAGACSQEYNATALCQIGMPAVFALVQADIQLLQNRT